MKKDETLDTIIAPITSTVGGSVALLRISGSRAITLTDTFFPAKNLQKVSGGRFFYGPLRDANKQLIDEVVLLIYKAPHSFSGEDAVEISFHANPLILERAINVFLNAGCRVAEAGEFSKRAFLNGKIDLVQAEAIADLIASKSQAAVKNSLFHISGKFSDTIKIIKKKLIETSSLLEIDLDFSGEEIDIITPGQIIDGLNNIIKEIDRLLSSYKRGRVLTEGIKVLITGKPNVGKSSIMNALLEKNRAIVSSSPGTTRDIIYEEIYIDQVLIRFIDSAGIHLTENAIEAEGIEKAREYFDIADLIILVIDISEPLSKDDTNLLELILKFYKEKLVVAGNKNDLEENKNTLSFLSSKDFLFYRVSAKSGTKIKDLKYSIPQKILENTSQISEEIFITNQRQFDMLKHTKEALSLARSGLREALGYEFIAVDMRDAINHLSGITGEISTDDILNTIFSKFCIGK